MNIISRKTLILLALLCCALMVSGCLRKQIDPNRRGETRKAGTPATVESHTPAPAPEPTVVEEKLEIIEETYVVDAPEEVAPAAEIDEGDLDAEPEPMVKEEAAVVHDEKVAEIKAEAKDAVESAPAKAEAEAIAPAPMGEMYYVQVGAFSDPENANNVLADLIEQGYTGSKMAKTEGGLYRIQAGAFTDKEAASAAQSKLLDTFPNGFVVKGMPEE